MMGISLQMIGSFRLTLCDCVIAREVFVMEVFMRLDGMRREANIFDLNKCFQDFDIVATG